FAVPERAGQTQHSRSERRPALQSRAQALAGQGCRTEAAACQGEVDGVTDRSGSGKDQERNADRKPPGFSLEERMRLLCLLSLLAAILAVGGPARADEVYPSHPVRIVVPYASGGSPDTVARVIAKALTASLIQSFFVDDKPGANGLIASDIVASAAPDGYTLLLASDGPIVIMPLLERGADPVERLTPVNLIGESAFVLLARTDLGVSDLKGVIALAKKKSLTFGSAGVGSQHHLAGELLKVRAGIDLVHVPYKGFGEEAADLLGGRIDLAFGGVPPALPFIDAKKALPIAVTSETRSKKLPSVRRSKSK